MLFVLLWRSVKKRFLGTGGMVPGTGLGWGQAALAAGASSPRPPSAAPSDPTVNWKL